MSYMDNFVSLPYPKKQSMNLKLLLILSVMVNHLFNAFSQSTDGIRVPAVAGRFYPANPQTLRADIDNLLKETADEGDGGLQALIVPHAGYVFSGSTAAQGFGQIRPDAVYKRIFLLGPSHQAAFDGASANNAFRHYATPLGNVEVDTATCEALMQADDVFCYLPEAHRKEHCLEVELPFLQRRLKQMPPIVPIIVSTHRLDKLKRIANALKPYFNAENLFVISSDFSHYPAYEDARYADKVTADAILSGSLTEFLKAIDSNADRQTPNLVTSACGQCPITVLLLMMQDRPDLCIRHLAYCNSGDSPYGEKDRVVGYHAFSVVRHQEKDEKTPQTPAQAFSLSAEEKQTLLHIARKSIENRLYDKAEQVYDTARLTPLLKQNCGAFVTLRINGKLRGCIGNLAGYRPLYQTVSGMAEAAAFEDPRFYPLTKDEFPDIHIDISVLSPLKRIGSADEFQLGKHGILMIKGEHRGTFLPQVAEETGWSKEEFLRHCAHDKAGLPWDGWRDAELYVYEAEVFDEKSMANE